MNPFRHLLDWVSSRSEPDMPDGPVEYHYGAAAGGDWSRNTKEHAYSYGGIVPSVGDIFISEEELDGERVEVAYKVVHVNPGGGNVAHAIDLEWLGLTDNLDLPEEKEVEGPRFLQ